ncbi:MAG: ABC transporter permease [Bacteroidota bacterium]
MNLRENIRVAFSSLRANWLRAVLTIVIISFGIMALVGILTGIDTAIYSLSDNLNGLGANTFSVEQTNIGVRGSREGRRVRRQRSDPFSYRQAIEFKNRYDYPADVSVSLLCTGTATVKYADRETNPNTIFVGMTTEYLTAKGYELEIGRNFNQLEVSEGAPVAIIGSELVNVLFNGKPEFALDKIINLGLTRVRVVGVTATRGSSMNDNQDNRVLMPLQFAKRFYGGENQNYNILIAVQDATRIDAAIAEATVLLRSVRRLGAGDENDFELEKSDSLIGIIKDNTATLRLGALVIALMTLLGAAIGLMNIMLVSVTERTREIGVRKALGATRQNVLQQFLIEAVVICQIGGVLGIILGVLAGNVVTWIIGGSFLFPWLWISLALVVCTAVGLLSGLYPAMRAAQLDPIESLRYE